jgi:RNA polymerase sigma-70 factor (ECF subfamily)
MLSLIALSQSQCVRLPRSAFVPHLAPVPLRAAVGACCALRERAGAFLVARLVWRAHVEIACDGLRSLREDMATSPEQVQPTDASLVARISAGDEQALGSLYDRYGRMAYSLAAAIVPDSADADEVVADAFAQLWRSASLFDASRGSVGAWLATIVRTRALDLVRAQRRRSRTLERAAMMSDEDSVPGFSQGTDAPDRDAESNEAGVLVRRSLADLPAPQRRVIELAYFGGLSQSEIATQLSEPLGTVKTRMRAGMEKLRQSLRPLIEAGR